MIFLGGDMGEMVGNSSPVIAGEAVGIVIEDKLWQGSSAKLFRNKVFKT